MSRTPSVGVVGADHWSYMAGVMIGVMTKVAESGKIKVEQVPAGVLADANRLFNLVLDEIDQGTSKNPPASIHAYVLVSETMHESDFTTPRQKEELDEHLRQCASFVAGLNQDRQIESGERILAEGLQCFFSRLQIKGENERYQKFASCDDDE